jgi:hypothetical protein
VQRFVGENTLDAEPTLDAYQVRRNHAFAELSNCAARLRRETF